MGGSAEPLPYLNANPNTVTFSGFSAGCFMSHQMSMIYSDEIQGAVLACCWPLGDKNTFQGDTTTNGQRDKSIAFID